MANGGANSKRRGGWQLAGAILIGLLPAPCFTNSYDTVVHEFESYLAKDVENMQTMAELYRIGAFTHNAPGAWSRNPIHNVTTNTSEFMQMRTRLKDLFFSQVKSSSSTLTTWLGVGFYDGSSVWIWPKDRWSGSAPRVYSGVNTSGELYEHTWGYERTRCSCLDGAASKPCEGNRETIECLKLYWVDDNAEPITPEVDYALYNGGAYNYYAQYHPPSESWFVDAKNQGSHWANYLYVWLGDIHLVAHVAVYDVRGDFIGSTQLATDLTQVQKWLTQKVDSDAIVYVMEADGAHELVVSTVVGAASYPQVPASTCNNTLIAGSSQMVLERLLESDDANSTGAPLFNGHEVYWKTLNTIGGIPLQSSWMFVFLKPIEALPGYFFDTQSMSAKQCERGEASKGGYSDETPTGCSPCEEGFFTDHVGASTCSPCEIGKIGVDDRSHCQKCVQPYTTEGPGQTKCNACIKGFFFDLEISECSPCPTSGGQPIAICAGGTVQPIPMPNHWSDRSRGPAFAKYVYQCLRDTCVASANQTCWTEAGYTKCGDASKIQCSSGATGILCGACESDFTFNKIRNKCVRCTSSEVFGAIVVIVLGAVAFVWSCTGIRHISSLNYEKVQDWAKRVMRFDLAKLKVCWVGATIISTVPSTVELVFPEPMRTLIYVYSFLEIDVWGGLGLDCYADGFNYMTRAYVTSAIPIAAVFVIWCVWCVRRVNISSGQKERLAAVFSQHVYVSLVLSYLVLPTVVSVQFKSLRCSELKGLGASYLQADTSIDCSSAEYQTFVGRVVWLLALYLLVPLAYLKMLHRVSSRLHLSQEAARDGNRQEVKLKEAMLMLQEESDPELRPLKFLFKGYRPQYWYWEVVESYRRIVFQSALAVVDTPVRRAYFGMILSVIGVAVYRELSPYKQTTTNMMNLVVSWQLFALFLYSSLLVSPDAMDTGVLAGMDAVGVATSLVVINLSMCVLATYLAWKYYHNVRREQERIRKAMAEKAEQEAEHAAEGHALPAAIQNFTPLAKVPEVEAIFQSLDACAAQAAKQVELERHGSRKSRKKKKQKSEKKQGLKASGRLDSDVAKEMIAFSDARGSELDFGKSTRDSQRTAKLDIGSEQLDSAPKEEAPPTATSDDGVTDEGASSSRFLPPTRGSANTSRRLLSPLLSTVASGKGPVLSLAAKAAPVQIDNVTKFLAELGESMPTLEAAIDRYCAQKDIIRTCDAVLAASSSGFEGVYAAVWNLIVLTSGEELEVFVKTASALKMSAEEGPGRGKAKQTVCAFDLGELYLNAANVCARFGMMVKAIGEATGGKTDVAPLKRISRILEKILLDGENPGSCEKVCDVVRAMITATSMANVAKIAMAFLESDSIEIVRVKDRFVEKPSPGGWRDLMINFYLKSDPNRHICEVQVVLDKMLVARKNLGGHGTYDHSRNALEILERLDAKDPAKRWELAAYLLDVEGRDASELVNLGIDTLDLMRAGCDESELLGAGCSDAEILSARDTITAKQLKRQHKGSAPLVELRALGRAMSKGEPNRVRRALSRAMSKVTPGT